MNIEDGINKLEYTHNRLMEINDYLQAIREEAVKGANGTYSKSDREKISFQVEQLLRQIIEISNNQVGGQSIFSGHKTDILPFEIQFGKSKSFGEPIIQRVKYNGDIGLQYREIDRGEYVAINCSR